MTHNWAHQVVLVILDSLTMLFQTQGIFPNYSWLGHRDEKFNMTLMNWHYLERNHAYFNFTKQKKGIQS
jgi:hypothetical protein